MTTNKKNFSDSTIQRIIERDSIDGDPVCRACNGRGGSFEAIPHHIFFKSQLFRACVALPENGAMIHMNCHRIIHHGSNEIESILARRYDQKMKLEAILMFHGIIPESDFAELIKIYRGRYGTQHICNSQPTER